MPPKLRQLISDLMRAGYADRSGKESHRHFTHPKASQPVTLSGKPVDHAKQYQEKRYQKDSQPFPRPTGGKAYSGKFMLRVDAELHRVVAIRVLLTGESLNTYRHRVLEVALRR